MTVCYWCQQPDPDVEWRGNPIITSASRPSKTVGMSDYTFRGCHASEKPRAPTGEFISQDGTTACRDGVTRAMCECGRVAEVVTDTEVLTRVTCECATAGTGCRVL